MNNYSFNQAIYSGDVINQNNQAFAVREIIRKDGKRKIANEVDDVQGIIVISNRHQFVTGRNYSINDRRSKKRG